MTAPNQGTRPTSLILSAATRLIAGLMLMFSVFMLLRGHNAPGGGFVGGLIAVTAFALYAKSRGTEEARRTLGLPPEVIAVAGLGCALGAGLVGPLLGRPFLTGQWLVIGGDGHGGGFAISNIVLFDIGVYLVVVGAVLTVLFALEEEV
ncbi:MAG: Na(+)/H(+) antiporter subunit B [Azospirillum sp.]|nr:Na(+)/H(+) antiporter subunit B [Azospirillum sp.]